MPIEAITSKLPRWVRAWQDIEPINQVAPLEVEAVAKKNRKAAEAVLYKDTLSSMATAEKTVELTVTPPTRPKLEPPKTYLNDAQNLRALYLVQQEQRKNKMLAGEAAIISLQKEQSLLRKMQEDANKVNNEMVEASKKTSLAAWIQKFLTFGLIASFLGKLIVSYFTGGLGVMAAGGAAVATAFNYLKTALAIAQGTATSFKMYWDNKSREHSREIFIIREKRDNTNKKVEKSLGQIKKSAEEESQIFSQLKKMLKAARNAFRAISN